MDVVVLIFLLGKFSTSLNNNRFRRGATLRSNSLDSIYNIHTINDLSEYAVVPVQPGRVDRADEKLRAVRAGASIGHRQDSLSFVFQGKVLVGELLSVN